MPHAAAHQLYVMTLNHTIINHCISLDDYNYIQTIIVFNFTNVPIPRKARMFYLFANLFTDSSLKEGKCSISI